MPQSMIIGLVVVVLLFVALFAWTSIRNQRRARRVTEKWRAVAEAGGWQLQPAVYRFFWKPPVLSRETDGVPVFVRCFIERQGDVRLNLKTHQVNPNARFGARYSKAETPARMPEQFIFSASLTKGSERHPECLQTGDADFDRVFNAYSHPVEMGPDLFNTAVRKHLLALAALSPDNVFVVYQAALGTIELQWAEIASRVEEFEHAAAVLVALSKALTAHLNQSSDPRIIAFRRLGR